MNWLPQYTARIERAISEHSFPEKPVGLYQPLEYFMQIGGKRIRPILTLLAAELFDHDAEGVMPQAIGLELFHNFTLIHDDIMDEAPLRRNMETLHQKYDLNTGILSGDVLLIKAYQQICRTESEKLDEVLELFNRTAVEVCEGQQMDMDFESREDVTVDEYIEMIRLKTSVLLGCSLEMGALLSGASKEDSINLYDFGVNIGIAFQIRDDILDLYADPKTFGKQVGGDIMANKKTILYLSALKNGSREQLEVLKQLKDETDLELKVGRTRELFEALNIQAVCKQIMNEYYERAIQALESISVPVENKSKLKELAVYLIDRDI